MCRKYHPFDLKTRSWPSIAHRTGIEERPLEVVRGPRLSDTCPRHGGVQSICIMSNAQYFQDWCFMSIRKDKSHMSISHLATLIQCPSGDVRGLWKDDTCIVLSNGKRKWSPWKEMTGLPVSTLLLVDELMNPWGVNSNSVHSIWVIHHAISERNQRLSFEIEHTNIRAVWLYTSKQ